MSGHWPSFEGQGSDLRNPGGYGNCIGNYAGLILSKIDHIKIGRETKTMKKAMTYKLTTGDTLTNIRDLTGNIMSCTIAKLQIYECAKSFDVTRDNKTGEVVLCRGWKLVDAAGEARLNAIMDALKVFFDQHVPMQAH